MLRHVELLDDHIAVRIAISCQVEGAFFFRVLSGFLLYLGTFWVLLDFLIGTRLVIWSWRALLKLVLLPDSELLLRPCLLISSMTIEDALMDLEITDLHLG